MSSVYNHMDKLLYRLVSSGLVIITLFTGSILVSSTTSATSDSVVDEINITVPVSCSLSGTGMNTHNAEIPNGTYQANIGSTTLTAFCNDANGFAIYATGYTGNEIGETNSNKLVGTSASSNATIVTGLATSTPNPDVSNWAMRVSLDTEDPNPTYPITIDNSFSSYHEVPNTYTKVAHRDSATDIGTNAEGSTIITTYAAYISKTQPADTYSGQVIYTLVHPSDEVPLQPVPCEAGKICYNTNGSNVVGTMAQQSANNSTTVTLYPSNFSRTDYGFAGWSDKYDYATDPNAHFYGPNEDFTTPSDLTTKGLSLYAVWIKSAGSIQNWTCPNSSTMPIGAVTALTDQRDNQTYAVAKLADGNCWMIENLRLDNTNSDNSTGAFAQGYGGLFAGLANPEETWENSSTVANSLYSIDGENNTINIGTSNAGYRFPRYNNKNTASRAENSTGLEMNTYSYGNYYTWSAAIADTTVFNSNNISVTDTSICPAGWHLPTGGTSANSANSEFWQLGVSLMGFTPSNNEYYTASEKNVNNKTALQMFRSHPNNFVYSGYNSTTNGTLGKWGYYRSSTASSSYTSSYYFNMIGNSGSVYLSTGTCSNYGAYPIRCVKSGS